MYKRLPSRDFSNMEELEKNSALVDSVSVEGYVRPSWKHALPHILVAMIFPFLFGYHLGVVNEPLESISLDLGFHDKMLAEGLVVSICLGGALVGSLNSGWIADKLGRRRSFQVSALPMIVGACLSARSSDVGGMVLGRFMVGLGMGVGPSIAALYVTEVSPAHVRGTYGSFIQIATCLGLMSALFAGIPVKSVDGWWRVCFWMSTVPAFALVVAMLFCAESPHWLYKQGRIIEAEVELERVLGASHAKAAMAHMYKSPEEPGDVRFTDLICGRFSRVVFIGSALFALQQLSGINAVFCFSSTLFKTAGIRSDLANVFVGVANLSGSVAAMALMDSVGRKVLLLWSFVGMATCMAVQVAVSSPYYISSTSNVSIASLLLFVLSFTLGAGPVPALLLPEILPARIRAKSMAICMSVHWVVNFMVGLFFLRLLNRLGPMFLYSIFAAFCCAAVLFVSTHVVETKGRSLHEIEIALLSP